MHVMLIWHVAMLTSFVLVNVHSAAVANDQYNMDVRTDCVVAGYLDVPRDKTVVINGRSNTQLNQQLTCYLQFEPQTDGDTMTMSLASISYINDCDVSLDMQLSDKKYLFGCNSDRNTYPTFDAVNGKAILRLVRKSFGDNDFQFQVTLTVKRSIAAASDGNSSSANVGMIVGIVVGIVVALLIALVVCVCCYRKRHNNDVSKNKNLLSKDPLSTISTCSYENTAAKNNILDYSGSEKKLLGKDGVDYENEKNKAKSALDRFGPVVAKSTKPYEPYNDVRKKEFNLNNQNVPVINDQNNVKKVEAPKKVDSIPKPPPIDMYRQASVASSNETVSSGQGNRPFFSDLRSNSKFRKSFRENDAEAEERARRVSSHTSTSSLGSEVVSKPLLPPASSSDLKQPQLPPVPKLRPRLPSPQRPADIAGVHCARPSSLTSDSSKLEKEDDDRKVSKLQTAKASKMERTPEVKKNVASQSNDSSDEKSKTKHNDKARGNKRSKKYNVDESSNSSESEYSNDKYRHRSKSSESKRRHRKHTRDDKSSDSDESEISRGKKKSRSNSKDNLRETKRRHEHEDRSDRMNLEKLDKDKYNERKFKKSEGVRKSKGKGINKMNRSKSTGSALEELESNYSQQSKSQGSVKSLNLNFIDEDIDLDSNLQTFKRAGSKTSLYASRTSLYGRKRKNSMGETISLSSYMYDDVESRISDFDRGSISQKDKFRIFKSTGDLEMKLKSSVVVRDCSTWTGSTKGVDVFHKRTFIKGQPDKCYSRGTQTGSHKNRTNSIASEASVYSVKPLKSRSKSQDSLQSTKKHRSHRKDRNRNPHDSSDDKSIASRSSRSRSRAKSQDSFSTVDTSDESGTIDQMSRKPKVKPKSRSQASDVPYLDDESVLSSPSYAPYQAPPMNQYIPVGYPVQPYYQPGPNYLNPAAVAVHPAQVPVIKPTIPPKPQQNLSQSSNSSTSKWDQLVNLTEGMKKRRHQMGESINDTESVMSSAWSEFTPYGNQPQVYYAPQHDPSKTYNNSSGQLVHLYGNHHAPSESSF